MPFQIKSGASLQLGSAGKNVVLDAVGLNTVLQVNYGATLDFYNGPTSGELATSSNSNVTLRNWPPPDFNTSNQLGTVSYTGNVTSTNVLLYGGGSSGILLITGNYTTNNYITVSGGTVWITGNLTSTYTTFTCSVAPASSNALLRVDGTITTTATTAATIVSIQSNAAYTAQVTTTQITNPSTNTGNAVTVTSGGTTYNKPAIIAAQIDHSKTGAYYACKLDANARVIVTGRVLTHGSSVRVAGTTSGTAGSLVILGNIMMLDGGSGVLYTGAIGLVALGGDTNVSTFDGTPGIGTTMFLSATATDNGEMNHAGLQNVVLDAGSHSSSFTNPGINWFHIPVLASILTSDYLLASGITGLAGTFNEAARNTDPGAANVTNTTPPYLIGGLSKTPSFNEAARNTNPGEANVLATAGTYQIGGFAKTPSLQVATIGDVLDAMTEALLTQNSQITEILSRVSITPIQAIVMVQPGGAITLEQYSSYRSERGNPLPIQNSGGWPDLTGADVHLWIARQQAGTPVMPPIIDIAHGSVQGTLSVPTGVKFDIPSANTALLSNYTKRGYAYCLVAYYSSNGDQVPITDWADCTAMPGIALAS